MEFKIIVVCWSDKDGQTALLNVKVKSVYKKDSLIFLNICDMVASALDYALDNDYEEPMVAINENDAIFQLFDHSKIDWENAVVLGGFGEKIEVK